MKTIYILLFTLFIVACNENQTDQFKQKCASAIVNSNYCNDIKIIKVDTIYGIVPEIKRAAEIAMAEAKNKRTEIMLYQSMEIDGKPVLSADSAKHLLQQIEAAEKEIEQLLASEQNYIEGYNVTALCSDSTQYYFVDKDFYTAEQIAN